MEKILQGFDATETLYERNYIVNANIIHSLFPEDQKNTTTCTQ